MTGWRLDYATIHSAVAGKSSVGLAIAFLLMAGLLLAPVWLVDHIPLVDYPNHLARAFVLAHIDDPAFRFQDYYVADWRPSPYMLTDLAIIGLQRVMPVEVAGRLVLSAYLVGLPLAVWFFLREANPGQELLALWALPLAYNSFFFWGMLAFCLSVVLCFLVLGVWLRYLARPRPVVWCVLLVLVTALYFTHLVGFAVAGVAVTSFVLRQRLPLQSMVAAWGSFLPGVLFYLFSPPGGVGSERLLFPASYRRRFLQGMEIVGFYTWTPQLRAVAVLLAVILFCLWWKNAQFRWRHRWLEISALLAALYCVLPQNYGTATMVYSRIEPFFLVTAIASVHWGRRVRWLGVLALMIFALRVGDVSRYFVAQQPLLTGLYRSIDVTFEHARVFPLVRGSHGKVWEASYSHFWASGVFRRGWRTPYLFADPGVHSLRFRASIYYPEESRYLPSRYTRPPDWARIQQDYDFVWAYNAARFAPDLSKIGCLVFEEGDLRVFRVHHEKATLPPGC